MKYLRNFNENIKEELYNEVLDLCESKLAFLLDSDFERKYNLVVNPRAGSEGIFSTIVVALNTRTSFTWNEIDDYIIPLFISLDKDYNCYPPFPSTSSDNNLTKDKFIRVQFKGLGNKYFSIDEIEDMKNYKEKIFSIGTLVSRKNKKES